MTIAEWRAAVEGYAATTLQRRREQAWVVSHLLIAAGCEPDKVTPAKLLGEKDDSRRRAFDAERRRIAERKRILARIAKDRESKALAANL